MRVLRHVTPTAEQLPLVADDGVGFRLIRGAAGSGKTTVALLRLRQLCASRINRNARLELSKRIRVLVLTFNRTLRGYIDQLVNERALSDTRGVDLTVDTFGRWAQTLVGPVDVLGDSDRRSVLQRLLRGTGVPTVAANLPYFVDEVEYITGRFGRENRPAYTGLERAGRGRSPPVPKATRERLLSDVVAPYEAWKAQSGKLDWNDVALAATSASRQRYDVVVVDEAQDFSANQVRAILAHLDADHVTTFIIDAVQRIYPRGFTWREVGIEMRPNLVFHLRTNHRNTAQIAHLAQSLVRGLPQEEDGVIPDASACNRQGPIPAVLAGPYSGQLRHMLAHVAPALARGETVAILHHKGGGWFDYTRQELARRRIVVLAFDVSVLSHAGVVFATTNNIYPACRRAEGIGGFSRLFDAQVKGRYGHLHSRDDKRTSWPTDRQAEVLYPGELSCEHLRRVDVQVAETEDSVHGVLGAFSMDVPVRHAPEVFNDE